MFTGIIQSSGSIENFNKKTNDFSIKTKLDLSNCKVGSSICCDGVCLTAKTINKLNDNFIFTVNVGEETSRRSNLIQWKKYRKINLEKSLKMGDEISGHFVYGHVDCVCKILEIKNLEHSWEFKFEKKLLKYYDFIVEKASIAINGISLTIANVDKNSFVISIIPHTFNNTNLQFSKEGDLVNVEFDYLARFILNKND